MSGFTRVTTRRVNISPGPAADLRLSKKYSSSEFRPSRLVEELLQSEDKNTTDGYIVTVSGPVVTKKGADHQSQVGEMDFGTGWSAVPLSSLPKEIKKLCVGKKALAEWVP